VTEENQAKSDKGGIPTEMNNLKKNEEEFASEYKSIITSITSFFKGNTKPIEDRIHEQIETAIIHKNYERAAQLRDIYQSLH
jgi:excinuclease UvrABC nuclease subunit